MAIAKFNTDVLNSMLGSQICFIDRDWLSKCEFLNMETYQHQYVFGWVDAVLVTLDEGGGAVYSISTGGDFYAVNEIDVLMLS